MNARVTDVDVGDSSTIYGGDEHIINIAELHSYATLQSINDDCLRAIFRYLDICDFIELASTCTRLQEFSNCFIFPKIARQVKIKMSARKSYGEEEEASMDDLKTAFKSFGSFVKQLTLEGSYDDNDDNDGTLRDFEDLLDLCPNLDTLLMEHVNFSSAEDEEILKHVTSNLKVLKLLRCSEITDDWSEAFKRLIKLERIDLTGSNDVTADYFKHSLNISTLAIDYESCSTSCSLEEILNQNGPNIQQLTLERFSVSPAYDLIGTLIVDKLPKLEVLAIDDEALSIELTKSLAKIPHLKCLKILCGDLSLNSLLRELSLCGKIEMLIFENGVFDKEDDNAPPLFFKKLLSVRGFGIERDTLLKLLKVLTKAQMPVIKDFTFSLLLPEHIAGLLALFESKETLELMTINCSNNYNEGQFAFVLGIIEILKMNLNRPYFKLHINPFKFNVEQVNDINS